MFMNTSFVTSFHETYLKENTKDYILNSYVLVFLTSVI